MAESETIERVARVICRADGCDPDQVYAFNPGSSSGSLRGDVAVAAWRNYCGHARAAIEAMREPSDAIFEAAENNPEYAFVGFYFARLTWRATIDAILSPSTKEKNNG